MGGGFEKRGFLQDKNKDNKESPQSGKTWWGKDIILTVQETQKAHRGNDKKISLGINAQ